MTRWWWPWHKGEGSTSWGYQCEQRLRDHPCIELRDHGWRHTSPSGFRWAA